MTIFCKIKKTFFTKNFLLFGIIGVINTIIYNEYYLISLKFFPYVISSIIGYLVSMTLSFLMNSVYNFKVKPTFKKYIMYPLTSIPTLFCQTFGLSFLVEFLNIQKEIAGFLASLLAIPFSFLIMKLVFKKK